MALPCSHPPDELLSTARFGGFREAPPLGDGEASRRCEVKEMQPPRPRNASNRYYGVQFWFWSFKCARWRTLIALVTTNPYRWAAALTLRDTSQHKN